MDTREPTDALLPVAGPVGLQRIPTSSSSG